MPLFVGIAHVYGSENKGISLTYKLFFAAQELLNENTDTFECVCTTVCVLMSKRPVVFYLTLHPKC